MSGLYRLTREFFLLHKNPVVKSFSPTRRVLPQIFFVLISFYFSAIFLFSLFLSFFVCIFHVLSRMPASNFIKLASLDRLFSWDDVAHFSFKYFNIKVPKFTKNSHFRVFLFGSYKGRRSQRISALVRQRFAFTLNLRA